MNPRIWSSTEDFGVLVATALQCHGVGQHEQGGDTGLECREWDWWDPGMLDREGCGRGVQGLSILSHPEGCVQPEFGKHIGRLERVQGREQSWEGAGEFSRELGRGSAWRKKGSRGPCGSGIPWQEEGQPGQDFFPGSSGKRGNTLRGNLGKNIPGKSDWELEGAVWGRWELPSRGEPGYGAWGQGGVFPARLTLEFRVFWDPAGRNEKGQLGHGDTKRVEAPRPIEALGSESIVAAACGRNHTLALTGTAGKQP